MVSEKLGLSVLFGMENATNKLHSIYDLGVRPS